MRVVYQPAIVDRLRDAKATALKESRTIEKVMLTTAEWVELTDYIAKKVPSFAVSGGLLNFDHDKPVDMLGLKCYLEPDDATTS